MTHPSLQNSDRCQKALYRLTQLHPKLIDLGLERTLALSEKMGAPHRHLPPTIHIAGTNGKGSTAALLRSLLEAYGFSVHVYASPHLCRFNERIRLAGKLISDHMLGDILERIEQANGNTPVTFFESTTVAGLTAFAENSADFLILETGLGGVFDSTNIIEHHACSLITPIAHDHEHFLGTTLSEIAAQKAGIMKPECPTIWAAQHPDARRTLEHCAETIRPKQIDIEGQDFSTEAQEDGRFIYRSSQQQLTIAAPALSGKHQIQNAGMAIHCLKTLGIALDADTISAGMRQAFWPARVQPLTTGKLLGKLNRNTVWLDGAHNAHGAKALANAMCALQAHQKTAPRKWVMVFGTLNTRPAADFLKEISPIVDKIYTLTIPDQPAAYHAEELCLLAQGLGMDASACADIDEVCQYIAQDKNREDMPVMICGSLYLAGHILEQNQTLPD